MLSERPDPWESTEKFKGRMNVKTMTCQDLGDSSIVAGAGAGMRACVSESQSMFETGKGFRQKFTSASVIPLRNAQVLRQELFEKYLLEDCGEAELSTSLPWEEAQSSMMETYLNFLGLSKRLNLLILYR